MADKEKEEKNVEKDDSSKPAETKIGLLTWLMMITIILALSGSGFILGRLLAGSASVTEPTPSQGEKGPQAAAPAKHELPQASAETWYYNDLKPVVVNPDEPGATRFVRVGLILEVSNDLSQDEAKKLIVAKSPLLINWLNLYFKGLSLDEMQNDKDMQRILSQICDGFNEILFPEAKPHIKKVLIGEFNIQ